MYGSNAVHDRTERGHQNIHRRDVGHAQGRKHREVHDAHAPAEIPAVHGDDQFEHGSGHNRRITEFVRNARRDAPGEMFAESKEQRGPKQEPRQNTQKRLRRGLDQKHSPGKSAADAREYERNHDTAGNLQMIAVRAATRSRSYPQGERVGGVCRNRRNAREQQCGKRDEAAAGNGIDCVAQGLGDEQEDGIMQAQYCFLSRFVPPAPPVRQPISSCWQIPLHIRCAVQVFRKRRKSP